MPNRRDFLKASGTVLLTGLTALVTDVNDAQASPHFDSKPPTPFSSPYFEDLINQSRAYELSKEHQRKIFLFTYEEWKDFNRYRESPESSTRRKQINGPHPLEVKATLMTLNPKLVFSLLTPKEKQDYELELILFDSYIDASTISIKYSLNIPREEFRKNLGAMIIWSFDRHYNYRKSNEKNKK